MSDRIEKAARVIADAYLKGGDIWDNDLAQALDEAGMLAPDMREGVEEAYQRGHEDGYWNGKTADMSPAQAAAFMAPYRSRCPSCADRTEGDWEAIE